MYFHQITEQPPPQEKLAEFTKKVNQDMRKAQRSCSDKKLEKTGSSELVYFTICRNSIHQNARLKFENQFVAVYWKSYPLDLRTHIASAFRMPKGKHNVKVDLVNAATRKSSPVTTADINSFSSFIITPIHGDVIIQVPEPGIYFINVSVDDRRIGSLILAAETNNPRWSYTLLPEHKAQVSNGELLNLLKRAAQGT